MATVGRREIRTQQAVIRFFTTALGRLQSLGRIWLNLELAKKPAACVEYILVHEMVHLLERCHTGRFRELMDALMPSWRRCRDELNRAPLAHEEWKY